MYNETTNQGINAEYKLLSRDQGGYYEKKKVLAHFCRTDRNVRARYGRIGRLWRKA